MKMKIHEYFQFKKGYTCTLTSHTFYNPTEKKYITKVASK